MTKDWRDGICIGVFLGMLMCCLIFCGVKAFFAESKVCEVATSFGKETHVRIGVVYE